MSYLSDENEDGDKLLFHRCEWDSQFCTYVTIPLDTCLSTFKSYIYNLFRYNLAILVFDINMLG